MKKHINWQKFQYTVSKTEVVRVFRLFPSWSLYSLLFTECLKTHFSWYPIQYVGLIPNLLSSSFKGSSLVPWDLLPTLNRRFTLPTQVSKGPPSCRKTFSPPLKDVSFSSFRSERVLPRAVKPPSHPWQTPHPPRSGPRRPYGFPSGPRGRYPSSLARYPIPPSVSSSTSV